MTYSQKLRDPRWQKKRLQILERDNWTCQSCRSTTKNLQVHHLVYRKIDPWDYADICYQTLCEECHPTRQELTDKIVDAIRLKIKNLSIDELEKMAVQKMGSAMSDDEMFDHYMTGTLGEAINDTRAGTGFLDYGLWSDAVMGLLTIQLVPNEPEVISRAKRLLGSVMEKLNASSNGSGEEAE